MKSSALIEQLARKYRTPQAVQKFLRQSFQYNKADTLQSALSAAKSKKVHCMEASLLAAAILEHHGHPPLIVSFESVDDLDHILYVFQEKGRWGAIGKSRDEGLHGRAPIYKTLKELTKSYFDHYIDHSGKITAYQIFDLRQVDGQDKYRRIDWRCSQKSVWALENILLNLKHVRLPSSSKHYKKLYKRYMQYGPLPQRKGFW